MTRAKTFADYFWALLPGWLKKRPIEEADAGVWVRSLGPQYDELQQQIVRVRQIALLATAAGQALDAHGQDRKMPRYDGELDDDYRRRLMNAFTFYSEVTTLEGMRKILVALGLPNAEIYPLYLERYNWPRMDGSLTMDGSWRFESINRPPHEEYLEQNLPGAWSMFMVRLNLDQPLTPSQERQVLDVIAFMKPAEASLYALEEGAEIVRTILYAADGVTPLVTVGNRLGVAARLQVGDQDVSAEAPVPVGGVVDQGAPGAEPWQVSVVASSLADAQALPVKQTQPIPAGTNPIGKVGQTAVIKAAPTAGSKTVASTAAALFAGASRLASRYSMAVYNESANTVYWGPSTVTPSNGMALLPGDFMVFQFDPATVIDVYFIAASNSSVRVVELA